MSDLTNLADEMERIAGEPIVCGVLSLRSWGASAGPIPPGVRPWDESRPHLDFEFGCGNWSGPDMDLSAMAWSESWVIFIHDYHAAHTVMRVPRFPDDDAGAPVSVEDW